MNLTGIEPYIVRKRLPELMRKGLAYPLGKTVPTKFGRKQRLWVATV